MNFGEKLIELDFKRYVHSEQNKILPYLGALLAFCGALTLVVEWRMRSASKRIERESK